LRRRGLVIEVCAVREFSGELVDKIGFVMISIVVHENLTFLNLFWVLLDFSWVILNLVELKYSKINSNMTDSHLCTKIIMLYTPRQKQL